MGERDKGRERQFDLKFERKRKRIKYFARLKTKTHYGGNSQLLLLRRPPVSKYASHIISPHCTS